MSLKHRSWLNFVHFLSIINEYLVHFYPEGKGVPSDDALAKRMEPLFTVDLKLR